MDTAIIEIRNNFHKQISELICKKVKHQDHCYDILQEVYIKVIRNIDKIGQAANARSYLLKMANNAVTDYYRKKSNVANDSIGDEHLLADDSQSEDSSLRLADCCLRPMIEQLEPIYRDALILVELDGLSHKQFADKTGISLTNAKTRVQRARQKLKEIIMNCCTYEFDNYGNIVSGKKNPKNCCSN